MEEQDNLEKKFSETFATFSRKPPEDVWNRIQREIQQEPVPSSVWDRAMLFPRNFPQVFRIVVGSVAASVILFLGILYYTSGHRCVVSGHVYAGESRLCKGTAYLFVVNDKMNPLDSIEHHRSAIVSENGFYRFSGIASGRYLLRIAPDAGSPMAGRYHPAWFDKHESPDSSHIIIVDQDDVDADVHLLEKIN